ncbi:MAG TPA: TPM domain-containing protein [Sphingobacteriaceae bacterium]|nr:TPM domain-containing protein [Sphingobacteriaceae bacterium]
MGIFNSEDQAQILHAISLAENRTSGEIRIAVEKRVKGTAMERAAYFFNKLGMHKTSLQNGVLIYLAVEDHAFAIIGDQGIHRQVGSDFWEETKALMLPHFRAGNMAEGLVAGVEHVGEQLKELFPAADGDINELPDEIFYGK